MFRIFTKSEIEDIRRVSLWDVITNTTSIIPDAIQRNVFIWTQRDPCPQPFQLKASMLDACVPFKRYDYFEVEIIFHFQFLSLFSSPYMKRKKKLHLRCFSILMLDSLHYFFFAPYATRAGKSFHLRAVVKAEENFY